MPPGTSLRVLLIRAWIHRLEPLRAALRDAGLDVHITRVDLEPALEAALTRGAYDVVIHDASVTGLHRDLVEARLRDHRHATPIVALGALDALATAVVQALARGHN
jgi:DNA-binding NtrC family response regulator